MFGTRIFVKYLSICRNLANVYSKNSVLIYQSNHERTILLPYPAMLIDAVCPENGADAERRTDESKLKRRYKLDT